MFSLQSVAPWYEEWETEREFIASSPERAMSQSRYDLSHKVVDLDPRGDVDGGVYQRHPRGVRVSGDAGRRAGARGRYGPGRVTARPGQRSVRFGANPDSPQYVGRSRDPARRTTPRWTLVGLEAPVARGPGSWPRLGVGELGEAQRGVAVE